MPRTANPLAFGLPSALLPVDPNAPLPGQMTPADVWGWNRQNLVDAGQAAMTPQTWRDAGNAYAQALLAGSVSPAMKGIPVYHAAFERFERPDFGRLGQTTYPNVSGISNEDWAMNLARAGFWTSPKSVAEQMMAPHSLPFTLTGNVKSFRNLDQLEAAVRKAGGPDAFRQRMIDQGYSHGAVRDEEFGGRSYVTFDPDAVAFGHPQSE